ncbi:hypothetical protein ACFX1X_012899 [Malus domestica]
MAGVPIIGEEFQSNLWRFMEKPDVGWLKCNFDGAWEENSDMGGIGVVVRDASGKFVAAMVQRLAGIVGI